MKGFIKVSIKSGDIWIMNIINVNNICRIEPWGEGSCLTVKGLNNRFIIGEKIDQVVDLIKAAQ